MQFTFVIDFTDAGKSGGNGELDDLVSLLQPTSLIWFQQKASVGAFIFLMQP
ncbi:hypothetical protein [Aeromonas veronii]|uniref:hypothetical protein n=1 Tax=Aeromonas veronii TaxID=654 RepID=UPI001F0222C1|nr:hypothetical protein [Aeromonas veronii]